MRYRFVVPVSRTSVVAMLLIAGTGCTMKSQDPPSFTGPSEFGRSITVSASPDVLSQDGMSSSDITVMAFGPNGAPSPDPLSLNVEIRIGGVRADFGSLSARNIRIENGRATLRYTVPPAPAFATSEGTTVQIAVTPIGTDFAPTSTRVASIRVIPVGPVVPPDGLAPHFAFQPASPQENEQVLFQACVDASKPACAPANNPVFAYEWDFGDGDGGHGQFETHAYAVAGSYAIKLTIVDQYGRRASTAQQVTVGAGVNPTASFVFSPSSPRINQTIAFNAAASAAAAGRKIVGYTWDFGDGTGPRGGGSTINYVYRTVGTYNVTLVVTDDAGKTAAVTINVAVLP